MTKNSFYISFGFWVIILPLLGIPGTWKNILLIASGLLLIAVSIGPTIFSNLQTKSKPKSRRASPTKTSKSTPVSILESETPDQKGGEIS